MDHPRLHYLIIILIQIKLITAQNPAAPAPRHRGITGAPVSPFPTSESRPVAPPGGFPPGAPPGGIPPGALPGGFPAPGPPAPFRPGSGAEFGGPGGKQPAINSGLAPGAPAPSFNGGGTPGPVGPPPYSPAVSGYSSGASSLPSSGYSGGGGPSYSGGGPSYSGGGPSYSGGGPSYSGGGPSYSSGGPSYSGGGPSYSGEGPSYSGGGPTYSGGSPSYAGGAPSYSGESSSYSGGGPSYSGGGPSYSGGGPSYSGGGPSYSGGGPSYSGGGSSSYSGSGSSAGGYTGTANSAGGGYASGSGSYGIGGGGDYGSGGNGYNGEGGYGNGGGGYGLGPSIGGGGCCGGGGLGGGSYGAGEYGGGFGGGCGSCGDNSDPCFLKFSNCIIVNAQPYERRSQISLDACKTSCKNATSGQFQCRSFVYDNINQICDLFAHVGNQAPAKLVRYLSRDYYEVTGTTNCTGTTPAPSTGPCSSGQTARYIQVPGYQYASGGAGTQTTASSIQACIDACNKGQTPDGKSITCKSFDFVNGQCTFYSSSPPPAGRAAGLQANSGSVHVDQICVDSGQNCVGPSERDPQMILVGFAEQVTDAKDFTECMQKCINAQSTSGITCKSGIFYYQETSNNCILNTETKATHPDLFNQENQDTVDYFEPNCGGASTSTSSTVGGGSPSAGTGGGSSRRLALLRGFLNRKKASTANSDDSDDKNGIRNDDDGSSSSNALGEWTHWSACDRSKDGRRIRYRVCSTKPSLKQCPFETEWCNTNDKASKKSQSTSPLFGLTSFALRNFTDTSDSTPDVTCPADVCCAVFGGCRIGLRRSSVTGQILWCTNPC